MNALLETLAVLLLVGGGVFLVYVALVVAHEVGHYLAGRWIVGVPPSDIRMVCFRSGLNYVTFRDDRGWIDPVADPARYDRRYRAFDPDGTRRGAFFAAGPVAQTIAVLPLAWLVATVGTGLLAAYVIVVSLGIICYALYRDVSRIRTRAGGGDFAALWRDSRVLCVGVLTAVIAGHLVALFVVW